MTHWNDGHVSMLHCLCVTGVSSPAAWHCSPETSFPELFRHLTLRRCSPPPQSAEHADHASVTHPASPHGLWKHRCEVAGLIPARLQLPSAGVLAPE
eukprot:1871741-Rhodomonas_salina.1